MAVTTFLFTDIEGSTRLWDEFGEAMDTALQRHDAILEGSVAAHGGRVFKHTGDGMLAAFAATPDAVAAAVDTQLRLTETDFGEIPEIRVRMAVHAAEASERDGDFFGPALNRTARLMDAARGGQVLLSAAAAELARRELPPGHDVRDLGEHRLKDLGHPERIHQLIGPGLADDLGPVRSLERRPNNLPVQLTSFVGRTHELDEIGALLADNRIVTLTGVGGVGKTRLALHVAAETIDDHPDGVWLVELAPLADAALVLPAIAGAAGVTEEPSRPLIDTVTREMGRVLLVLDNCEHLIDEVAKVVDELLRRCPDLRILATSREGLAVAGERLWRCPSMMASGDAVTLFVERADLIGGVDADDPSTMQAIERICRRLDGIPLAIELATARLKVFSPEQLAERLDDRFRLLTGGARTAMPRQRTLQAAMDWSHDLLPEHERVLLRRLGVFHGGFTLDLVERVCTDDAVPEWEVLDLVTHLVDASLVTFETSSEEPRYRLLETVRQYAMDRLFEADEAETFRRRHAVEFEVMMRDAERGLLGSNADVWAARCRAEADNVRAALTWAIEAGESSIALRLASEFSRYWAFSGLVAEGAERLSQVVRFDHEDSSHFAEANSWLAHFLFLEGKLSEAVQFSERSIEVAERIDDEDTLHRSLMVKANLSNAEWKLEEALEGYLRLADMTRAAGSSYLSIALTNIAMNAPQVGRLDEARAACAELVAFAESSGQEVTIALARSVSAVSAFFRGDFDEAREHIAEGEKHGHPAFPQPVAGLAMAKANLALFDEGDLDAAEAHVESALKVLEQMGQPEMIDLSHRLLGRIALGREQWDEAIDEFATVVDRVLARPHDHDNAAWLGSDLAEIALVRGNPDLAATLAELDRLRRAEIRWTLPVPWQAVYADVAERIEEALPDDRLAAARARAASMEGRDIVELIDELRASG